jgi:GT2 family glycosyltransferase
MKKEDQPLVSVVIPTFKRKQMLLRCVNSVLNSSYKNIEVIVADDASQDGTKNAIRKYNKIKKLKYIQNKEEKMLSYTINKALRKINGKLVFILDDDNVIDKMCISEMVNSFNKSTQIGIVGPLALYYSQKNRIMHAGTKRSVFMRRAIYPHINEIWSGQIKEGEKVEDFANAFMFRYDLLRKVGMWDLLIPLMGEDGDFEARVKKAHYDIIINPKAITYHDIPFDPNNKYFMRINDMRMYHVLHSKILHEARYDNPIGKLTFSISLPVYIGFYFYKILKSDNAISKKLHLMRLVILGAFKGIIDSIMNKNFIEKL